LAAAASACRFYPQPRRGMWSSQRLCAHHDSSLRSSLLRYRSEWTSKISSPSPNAMLNLSTPWVDSVPLGFDSPASSPGDSTEIANGEENRGGNWGPSDFTDIFRRPLHRRQVQDLPNSLDVELAKQLDGHLCYHRSSGDHSSRDKLTAESKSKRGGSQNPSTFIPATSASLPPKPATLR